MNALPPSFGFPSDSFGADDLSRVYLQARDGSGRRCCPTAAEATDAQFDAWARRNAFVGGCGCDGRWDVVTRTALCRELVRQGRLALLPKEWMPLGDLPLESNESEREQTARRVKGSAATC